MKVIRDDKYTYVGVSVVLGIPFLTFRSVRYDDELILTRQAKYIITSSNQVQILAA